MGSNADKFMGMMASPQQGWIQGAGCVELPQPPVTRAVRLAPGRAETGPEAQGSYSHLAGCCAAASKSPPPQAGTARLGAPKPREPPAWSQLPGWASPLRTPTLHGPIPE